MPSIIKKIVNADMPSISPADPPTSDKNLSKGYATTSVSTLGGISDRSTRSLVTFLNKVQSDDRSNTMAVQFFAADSALCMGRD